MASAAGRIARGYGVSSPGLTYPRLATQHSQPSARRRGMRDFITYPTVPTFANPSCRPECHPPDHDQWEREIQPVIEWIVAGGHLAPFPHPLVATKKKDTGPSPPIKAPAPYR